MKDQLMAPNDPVGAPTPVSPLAGGFVHPRDKSGKGVGTNGFEKSGRLMTGMSGVCVYVNMICSM